MRPALVTLLLAGSLFSLEGQRILYDGERDAKAQAAASTAKDVASAALFDSELKNLDTLARQQLEIVLGYQPIQVRSQINAFDKWSQVRDYLGNVHSALKQEMDNSAEQAMRQARLAEISKLEDGIRKAVADAAKQAGPRHDEVEEILSHT